MFVQCDMKTVTLSTTTALRESISTDVLFRKSELGMTPLKGYECKC